MSMQFYQYDYVVKLILNKVLVFNKHVTCVSNQQLISIGEAYIKGPMYLPL